MNTINIWFHLGLVTRIVLMATAAMAGLETARAQTGTAQGNAGQTVSAEQREVIRRQERVFEAQKAIEEGEDAERRGDLKLAREKYAFAIMNLGSSPATAEAGNRARHDLVRVNFALYKTAQEEGDTPLAKVVLEEILIIEPENDEAKHKLADLEEWIKEPPDTAILGNPAVTPSFVKKVKRVDQLFIESEQYLRTGQYDKAEEALNTVLALDPYNTTAARKLRTVIAFKTKSAVAARDHTRAERLREVEEAWNNPPTEDIYKTQQSGEDASFTLNPTFGTAQKLRNILVPELNFVDATIEDAAVFFSSTSKQQDPNNNEGLSFIVTPEAAATAKRFTLRLRNVPMEAALRYVTQLAQVKYKPEEFAVVIVPLTQPNIVLINRSIPVSPDFFQTPEGDENEDEGGGRRGRRPLPIVRPDAVTAASSPSAAKAILEDKGVEFPPGATAVYSPTTGLLQVKNTAEQIELIEVLISAGQAPVYMVDVKTKFVEIGQEDVNELTVNSGYNLLGPVSNVPGSQAFLNWIPITNNEFNPGGLSYSTALRGSQGFNVNSLNSLLLGAGAASPNVFSISGTIDNNLFNAVISSLAQKKSFDDLASPNLRVRNGEDAKINISRTFFYPTQFDPPETVTIQDTGTSVSVDDNDFGPPTVIPAFPTEFESRDVGVALTIKPQIGADKKTIDLALFPEITDFEGFINYGDPIFVVNSAGTQLLMTNNVINQPVFDTRRVQTSVFVKDGYTVVLGGLIRDDTQTINDKVPILGDMPFVGRMFQSKATQVTQTNLLIFVSCQIYLNNGELLNPPDYQLVSPTTGETINVPSGPGAVAQ